MKVIVDANIVFSSILNSNGKIGDILINSQKHFGFIATDFLRIQMLPSIRKIFILFLFLTYIHTSYSQDSLQISLLSCSPGSELYSTFGHSAFRIKDSKSGEDMVYNYGTFNFREKNFYIKFCQGKLLYYLTREKMADFLYEYSTENRKVYEQIFDLSREQAAQLYQSLQINALPANRAYKYDFFWDNCSTRIRDKIEEIHHEVIKYPTRPDITFRDYLHHYLKNSPWSRFGIDLILGMPCDDLAHTRESMFLPLEMMYVYDSTAIHGKSIATSSAVLQPTSDHEMKKNWITPFSILLLLLILVLICNLRYRAKMITKVLNASVMILCGISGLIISYLWFISDHTTTHHNLNLIWANPLLLLYPFRKKIFSPDVLKWLSRIFLFCLGDLFFFYPYLPQSFPMENLLIWGTLLLIIYPEALIKLEKALVRT